MTVPTFPDYLGPDGLPRLVSRRHRQPRPWPVAHPFHDRLDDAVLDALRVAGLRGRARSGLARVIRDAGCTSCSPTGDDRQVVFTLERLADKGYVIFGHPTFVLRAEPIAPRVREAIPCAR